MPMVVAGQNFTGREAIVVNLRRLFAHEGKPLVIDPEHIVPTGHWRTGNLGWKATGFLKRRGALRRVRLVSLHPITAYKRGLTFEFAAPDYVVIQPDGVDTQQPVE